MRIPERRTIDVRERIGVREVSGNAKNFVAAGEAGTSR